MADSSLSESTSGLDRSPVDSGLTEDLLSHGEFQLSYSIEQQMAMKAECRPGSSARGESTSTYNCLKTDPSGRNEGQPPGDSLQQLPTPSAAGDEFGDWLDWTGGQQDEIQCLTEDQFNTAYGALNEAGPGFYGGEFDNPPANQCPVNNTEVSNQTLGNPDFQQHLNAQPRQFVPANAPLSPSAAVVLSEGSSRWSIPGIQIDCYVPRNPDQEVAQGQNTPNSQRNATEDERRPNVKVLVRVFQN